VSFEYPWLAWGAIAALIPIAIHLINRQRAPIVRFAALEHLLMSDKRLAQRLKLRQLIVLILRMALIMFLAFAMAKPYLTQGDSEVGAQAGPGSVAIIIDDSLSMNARPSPGEKSLVERAIDIASERVASEGPQTSFSIIASGEPARVLTPSATFDRESVSRALLGLRASERGPDMIGALREAERLLAETGQERRHVVIISDHAKHTWEEVKEAWVLDEAPTSECVDVRGGKALANQAIQSVEVRSSLALGPHYVKVTTEVANFAEVAAPVELKVNLGSSSAKASLRLEAGAIEKVDIELARPKGQATKGEAILATDVLKEDNLWPFGLGEGKSIDVGLVNGAPHDVSTLDEVFFLRAALESKGPGAPIRTTILDASKLLPQQLEQLDVLILANPGVLTPSSLSATKGFVMRGGGLFISAGDRLGPEAARELGELLPLPIRGHKQVADPKDPNAALSALRISDFDLEHPVTGLFAAVDEVSLLKAQTYKVALLEPKGQRAKVLASFTGGIPALVEASLGQGRCILVTTTIDRDWSDLALRTSFVPLVHQVIEHLAKLGEGRRGAHVILGERVEVPLPEGRGGLVLVRPDGAEIVLDAPEEELEGRAGKITLRDVDISGRYTLRRRSGAQKSINFNAHADPRESDLSVVDPTMLKALLASPEQVADSKPSAPPRPRSAEESGGYPLWPILLVTLFGLLASESWFVLKQ